MIDDKANDNNSVFTYSTRYSMLNDSDLHALFRSEIWFGDNNNNGLNLNQKIDAIQEIVNRDSVKNNVDSAKVFVEKMSGNESGYTFGYRLGNTINMNETIVDKGIVVLEYKDYNGNNIQSNLSIPASNWASLNTAYHESTHNIQHQQAMQNINSDDPTLRTHAEKILANEKNYMNSGLLYDVSILEREANARADDMVKNRISELDRMWSQDKNSAVYMSLYDNDNVYAEKLDNAVKAYGDVDIEKTIDQVMRDRVFGTNTVDNMDSAVRVNREIENVYGRGMSVILNQETDARLGPLNHSMDTQNGFVSLNDSGQHFTGNDSYTQITGLETENKGYDSATLGNNLNQENTNDNMGMDFE